MVGFVLANAREAHEGHSQEAGNYQCDWGALHAFREFGKGELLADTSEECKSQAEAESGGDGEQYTGEEVVVQTCREFVGSVSYED